MAGKEISSIDFCITEVMTGFSFQALRLETCAFFQLSNTQILIQELQSESLRARKKAQVFDLKLSFIIHVAEKPPKITISTQIILDTIEWGVIQK